ncbi:hypothetical protein HPP92_005149 [Vanilla planifolia]|uniref:Replication protein A C-terminal domain-containing protein n=1 Tax=Vanilla planifolia TaxID=51239 RepID=A0A835VEL9_VANPL|nr:hypothetical protein HPP92_005149 [Vanilla planifolia]
MSLSQFDGGASFFSGGGFASSQSTQSTDPTLSKSRSAHGVIPLTVKQISDAYQSSENKAALAVDGVDAANVVILGLVTNKTEKSTDVSFTLDDGTGRINVIRWVNDSADADEGAPFGYYKTLEECHPNLGMVWSNAKTPKMGKNELEKICEQAQKNLQVGASAQLPGNLLNPTPTSAFSGAQENHLTPNQHSAPTNNSDASADIYKLVLDVFEEPASLASEHGLHVDEVARKLGIPLKKIQEAIEYHVDVGHVYSTIDDYHFKSACTS